MKIAVLMTCHNRKEKTIGCLNHLYTQNVDNSNIIDVFLVDDGSTDGTSEAINKLYPEVNVIKGNGELYWNRGMCLAWEKARAESIYDGYLWLNDDTMLYPNALNTVIDMEKKYPNSIVVASIESLKSPGLITYGGMKNGKIVCSTTTLHKECDIFNGNFVFIPTSVSDCIGYLDPYYRHSLGDFDYARRAIRAGVKCYVTPIIGSCERNSPEPIWNRGSLAQRFRRLYSPLGNNPFENYYFLKKDSYIKAALLFLYIHIRVLLTFIWPKK